MKLEVERIGDHLRVRVGGPVGMEDVAKLYERLAEATDGAARIEVDAAGVERVHAGAVQVFCRYALQTQDVEVLSASPAWEEAVGTLGCFSLLPRIPTARSQG